MDHVPGTSPWCPLFLAACASAGALAVVVDLKRHLTLPSIPCNRLLAVHVLFTSLVGVHHAYSMAPVESEAAY